MTREKLTRQFQQIDTDNSGQIDVLEMLEQMPNAAELDAAREVLKMMDIDINGQISLEEYIGFNQAVGDPTSYLTLQSDLNNSNESDETEGTLDDLLGFIVSEENPHLQS